ncbi:MAG TPA: YbaB/EbfC family nucleoid-associated protein [Jatrophihabitantaceae bacterium]|jgi:DNA-binding protein YbaB
MQLSNRPDDLPSTAGIRAYAEELEKRFWRLQEEGPKLQERARSLQVTEKSGDGLIAATVGARGELLRLDIDPRIYRRPDARALADDITETIKKAGAKARDEVVELFATLVPREQVAAQMSGDTNTLIEMMHKQFRGEG